MKTIRFGIIGGGLMGREFASAAARWMHLTDIQAKPEIVALCDKNPAIYPWYQQNFPTLKQVTDDYKALLANKDVDGVYIAVPHNLHAELYCAAIAAGKHVMGEKPFGIDKKANDQITAAVKQNPKSFVRCSSESIFYPAMQQMCGMIESNAFGQVIEVNSGFLHSSDLDPSKPINWKRMIEFNGEYGVLGDLGMHALHVPFRAGWYPKNVRAILSDIVKQRPDGKGNVVPCKTWDNGVLLCEATDPNTKEPFPLTIKLQRISPGQKNSWYTEVYGTRACAKWHSSNPKELQVLKYDGGDQVWGHIQTGFDPAFKTITGGIFEFGFTDSIQQMWAAFVHELTAGKPLKKFAGCVTPDEVAYSHRLFTAALESHKNSATIEV